ncbi:MAG TPA: hypothetical protein VMV07_25650 [Streptosporangiaceae bacterium]|nr:hypothetical protein [Streptosporangiaceae bacterium]
MATYRGAPYEAGIGPADGAVVLFAACPPPEELGFEPATGHWRKELLIQDVQAVWQSRPVGTFRGDSCIVLDDLGDRLHIGYLGHDAYRAEQLGYWQVDRGVFELVAGREEVTDIVEERTDYQPGVTPQASHPALPPLAEPGYPQPAGQASSGYPLPAGPPGQPRMPPLDGGVALPQSAAGPPLPLEAQAMRAASAASRRDQAPPSARPTPPGGPEPVGGPRTAAGPGPATGPQPTAGPGPGFASSPGEPALYAAPVPSAMPDSAAVPAQRPAPVPPDGSYSPDGPYSAEAYAPGRMAPPGATAPGTVATATAAGAPTAPLPGPESPRRRRSAGRRMATERIFGELASLAAIPAASYSVGEEVDGAMCLLETAEGFEVFSCAAGARHEVRVFSDEESACFYLFGVLAADAVRTGGLVPGAGRVPAVASVAGSRLDR